MGVRPQKIIDFAQWNTNAINQYNNLSPKEVELYVIATHPNLRSKVQSFSLDGVHYVFFNDSSTTLWHYFKCRILRLNDKFTLQNKRIAQTIKQISPDIVHLMGAENPQYALSTLSIPRSIPVLAQLQTLLSDPKITESYPKYMGRAALEKEVLQRADYIGTATKVFPALIRLHVKSNPIILNTTLALGERVNLEEAKKTYDFVYFASSISKAADLAIEAFALANKKDRTLTLDIIGGCSEPFTSTLKERIKSLGIQENVFFEGQLNTHEDVMRQIRKSKYALLPLKTDLISGTIREAMCNGLPVLTTKTDGTPVLNSVRESVLISEIGDDEALAENMLKLVADPLFATKIKENAAITVLELFSDEKTVTHWIKAYNSCLAHFQKGVAIPSDLQNSN